MTCPACELYSGYGFHVTQDPDCYHHVPKAWNCGGCGKFNSPKNLYCVHCFPTEAAYERSVEEADRVLTTF